MRQHWTWALAALALVALPACSDGTGTQLQTEFEATLTGAAERPTPVTTTATGTASVEIDDAAQTLTFSVSVTGLLTPTLAHIHVGSTTEAGPIVVNLLLTPPAAGSFTGVLTSGTRASTDVIGGETFTTLVAKIRSGNAYINVHTAANAAGELRGQLLPE